MSETQVKGLAELQKALDELPEKIAANVMRGAMRAGAKVLADEARLQAPVLSGELRDTIRHAAKIENGVAIGYVRAGPRGGKNLSKADAKKGWYVRFVEFGTAAHIIKARKGKTLFLGVSKVNHPGATKKPFMRSALDQGAGRALAAVAGYIRKRLAAKHGINVPDPEDAAEGGDK